MGVAGGVKAGVENGCIYSAMLQNTPFRSRIFKIFFASGGKGALIPLIRIVRTLTSAWSARTTWSNSHLCLMSLASSYP